MTFVEMMNNISEINKVINYSIRNFLWYDEKRLDIFTIEVFIYGFKSGRNKSDEEEFFKFFCQWATDKQLSVAPDNIYKLSFTDTFLSIARKKLCQGSELYDSKIEIIAFKIFQEAWIEFIKVCPKEKYPHESKQRYNYRSIDEI